jgi:DNA-directed RNA polymerase specialized sigma24 family protein
MDLRDRAQPPAHVDPFGCRGRAGSTQHVDHHPGVHAVAAATDVESVVPSLQEAIASLPPADQSIVRLRVVERLDYATLAEQLACTEGAARVRASRALARLRRELLERVPDLEERLA